MATVKWVAPEAIASALTTELNSLANGGVSSASGAIDNETGLYQYISLELYLGSLNPTGTPIVQVYLISTLDATNYDDTTPPTFNLLTTFDLTTGATAKRRTRWNIPIPPLAFKLIVKNGSGVAFASTTNTLKYRRYNAQVV
jgi:hypothetical protein